MQRACDLQEQLVAHLGPDGLQACLYAGHLGFALLAPVQQLHPLPLARKSHHRRRPTLPTTAPAALPIIAPRHSSEPKELLSSLACADIP